MGGSDDPSNLIELTIEEHAEAHRLLYEEHGQWQDYIAWKGLSGQIPNSEIIKEVQRASGREMGRRLVESGQWSKIQSLGGKVSGKKNGKIQGKKNVESGHWASLQTHEIRVKGGKACPPEVWSQNGKKTTSLPVWKEIASRGGKIASAKSNRKVKSLSDGYVTTFAARRHHEKRTGYTHEWEDVL